MAGLIRACIATVAVAVVFNLNFAFADCGSIPFRGPLITKDTFKIDVRQTARAAGNAVKAAGAAATELAVTTADVLEEMSVKEISFDPLKVTVFEPKQRAIILWNGEEEVLLLSTDQKASQATAILEVIPLPSEPTISLGDFDTFEKAQSLMVKKQMWAVAHAGAKADLIKAPQDAGKITFEQKMGSHDLTVAQVVKKDQFVPFVQSHLKKKYGSEQAPIRDDFVKIINSYIDDGFEWFAFDVILLNDKVASRQPIEYRFKTKEVFYPMRISKLEQGTTEVELLVFANRYLNNFEGLGEKYFKNRATVQVTPAELVSCNEKWQGFFKPGKYDLSVHQWSVKGNIAKFNKDVRIK